MDELKDASSAQGEGALPEDILEKEKSLQQEADPDVPFNGARDEVVLDASLHQSLKGAAKRQRIDSDSE